MMASPQILKKRPISNRTKRSLSFCLAFILIGWLVPSSARAFWGLIPVNQTNIDSTAPFVRIISQHYGTNDSITEFSVFVLMEKKGDQELFSGLLQVKDANEKSVAQTEVQAKKLPKGASPSAIPKSWTDKCIVYRFTVDASFLAHSEFSLNQTGDPVWGTVGVSYRFNLKEFDRTK
jgi:hypothetical protein